METTLLLIAAVIVLLVLTMLARAALKSPVFHLERSILIDRPPALVFAFVSDFRNYATWSPWEKLDPTMTKTIKGAPGMVGSFCEWSGNNKVGAGKMLVVAVTPNEKLEIKLDFLRPFATTSITTWSTTPQGAQTRMTWSMDGRNETVFRRLFSMLMMESMLGKSFGEGLALLKLAVERGA